MIILTLVGVFFVFSQTIVIDNSFQLSRRPRNSITMDLGNIVQMSPLILMFKNIKPLSFIYEVTLWTKCKVFYSFELLLGGRMCNA